MFVCILPACLSVYCIPAVTEETDEGVKSPRTGITDSCEPPHGCWEPIGAGPAEDQLMLLTAEPSSNVLICHSVALRAPVCSSVTWNSSQRDCCQELGFRANFTLVLISETRSQFLILLNGHQAVTSPTGFGFPCQVADAGWGRYRISRL